MAKKGRGPLILQSLQDCWDTELRGKAISEINVLGAIIPSHVISKNCSFFVHIFPAVWIQGVNNTRDQLQCQQ